MAWFSAELLGNIRVTSMKKAGKRELAPFLRPIQTKNLKMIYNFSWNSHAEQEI